MQAKPTGGGVIIDGYKGAVRVTIPASVAYDLGALQKGFANLAERMGCRTCFSGADCAFTLERNFIITNDLAVHSTAGDGHPSPWRAIALPQDPVPLHSVEVTLAPEVSNNLEKIQTAVAQIVDRLGHPSCFSGFDFAFSRERHILVDSNMNIHSVGEGF